MRLVRIFFTIFILVILICVALSKVWTENENFLKWENDTNFDQTLLRIVGMENINDDYGNEHNEFNGKLIRIVENEEARNINLIGEISKRRWDISQNGIGDAKNSIENSKNGGDSSSDQSSITGLANSLQDYKNGTKQFRRIPLPLPPPPPFRPAPWQFGDYGSRPGAGGGSWSSEDYANEGGDGSDWWSGGGGGGWRPGMAEVGAEGWSQGTGGEWTQSSSRPAITAWDGAPVGVSMRKCGKSFYRIRKQRWRRRVSQRIVGGMVSEPHSLPWLIRIENHGQLWCGGSLIRVSERDESDIVLSAGHCFDKSKKNPSYSVVAGAHHLRRIEPGEQKVPIIDIARHAGYYNKRDIPYNDLALWKLAWPIRFSRTIQPICLPAQDERPPAGAMGMVAGWGDLDEHGDLSYIIRQAEVPVISQDLCKLYYKREASVTDGMLCAGYRQGGVDHCFGDSGGPLFFPQSRGFTLHGIVSFADGCARPRHPGVYTRVSTFTNWIQRQIYLLTSVR